MKEPKVAVLLCMRNAEAFLREQMESLFAQEYGNWELWISDDNSTDGSLDVIGEFSGRGKKITVVCGPCQGVTGNFMSLTRSIRSDARYFAWADADDIWLPDKLTRAVRTLEGMNQERPALYCARTLIVNRYNQVIYLSSLYRKTPCFGNALCQNIAGGNTMAFNRKLRDLLCFHESPEILFHDWWAYILATGCGGQVHYDPTPCLRYRQHGGNLIGCNKSLSARLQRGFRLFCGVSREWNRAHIVALRKYGDLLVPENRAVLDLFATAAGTRSPNRRLEYFLRSGVRRQAALHNVALSAATLLGKYP
jgi:glycosyltransferase involved in cell wall biosynthesis